MKRYLGDGVYVKFDGFGFMLTSEDGISVTNEIYLEPEVLDALNAYVVCIEEKANLESKALNNMDY